MKKLKWRHSIEFAVSGKYNDWNSGRFCISRRVDSKGRFLLESGTNDVGMFKTLAMAKKVAQLIHNG